MTITHTHVCPLYMPVSFQLPSSGACAKSMKASKDRKYPGITFSIVEVLLSQFEWKSRDLPTKTRLMDRYRSTDSLSFVTPANFPCAVTVRRMANDVTHTMYTALPNQYVYNLWCNTNTNKHKYIFISYTTYRIYTQDFFNYTKPSYT